MATSTISLLLREQEEERGREDISLEEHSKSESINFSNLCWIPLMVLLKGMMAGRGMVTIARRFRFFRHLLDFLAEHSAVYQQLAQNFDRLSRLPQMYSRSRQAKGLLLASPETLQNHFSLHNELWLLANDIVLGCLCGAMICWHAEGLATLLYDFLFSSVVLFFEGRIVWLMGWPAGLKLNSNLGKFLGEMFLWLVSVWAWFFARCMPIILQFPLVVALSGILGLSLSLAMLIDLTSLLTIQVQFFYLISSRLYAWQLGVLGSLSYLFRGKKWNVLRGHSDWADYDLDQLLLGTVLFSLVVFLFPTMAVYHLLFLFSYLVVFGSWLFLELLLIICNHLPLFELAVRLLNGRAFAGQTRLELHHQHSDFERKIPVIRIFQRPASFTTILAVTGARLLERLRMYINVPNLCAIFNGGFISLRRRAQPTC